MQANIGSILNPSPCSPSHWMLLIVSSAPTHRNLRDRWRSQLEADYEDIKVSQWERNIKVKIEESKVVFLISKSADEEMNKQIQREYDEHGDVLQVNILDSYRLQNYKLIFGKLINNINNEWF